MLPDDLHGLGHPFTGYVETFGPIGLINRESEFPGGGRQKAVAPLRAIARRFHPLPTLKREVMVVPTLRFRGEDARIKAM